MNITASRYGRTPRRAKAGLGQLSRPFKASAGLASLTSIEENSHIWSKTNLFNCIV